MTFLVKPSLGIFFFLVFTQISCQMCWFNRFILWWMVIWDENWQKITQPLHQLLLNHDFMILFISALWLPHRSYHTADIIRAEVNRIIKSWFKSNWCKGWVIFVSFYLKSPFATKWNTWHEICAKTEKTRVNKALSKPLPLPPIFDCSEWYRHWNTLTCLCQI